VLTPALLNAWLVNQHLASTYARYREGVARKPSRAGCDQSEMITYHRVLAIGNTGLHIRALRTPPTPLVAGPAPPYQKNLSPVAQTDHESERYVDGRIGKPSGFACGQRSSGSVCSLGIGISSGCANTVRRLCDIRSRSRLRAIRRARQEDTGMSQMWDIADHGGKYHDPVNGPPTTWVHRLEGVGRTARGDELTREARAPKKISRAGATPVCAALEPPQTRFVPIVTSGVAPALGELPLVMHPCGDEH
jgi:hypothetical protein